MLSLFAFQQSGGRFLVLRQSQVIWPVEHIVAVQGIVAAPSGARCAMSIPEQCIDIMPMVTVLITQITEICGSAIFRIEISFAAPAAPSLEMKYQMRWPGNHAQMHPTSIRRPSVPEIFDKLPDVARVAGMVFPFAVFPAPGISSRTIVNTFFPGFLRIDISQPEIFIERSLGPKVRRTHWRPRRITAMPVISKRPVIIMIAYFRQVNFSTLAIYAAFRYDVTHEPAFRGVS